VYPFNIQKAEKMLHVKNLKVDFEVDGRQIRVLHGVDLNLAEGETLGLVGESGCGKSVTCMTVLGLLGSNSTVSGEILYDGTDLLKLSPAKIEAIRGKDITMIFQDPVVYMNPVKKIGNQITEVIHLHEKCTKEEADKKAIELLRKVGIPHPESRMRYYPHQLSGGLCQRVMIAMALACKPKLLMADEPTTALDVTVQAQILDLLKDLNKSMGMATILVTHDLGVIAENVKRVMVMYAGVVVEEGPVAKIFSNPSHPYTEGLLNSLPKMDNREADLVPIEGTVPAPDKRPQGCCFGPRCKYKTEECLKGQPKLTTLEGEHKCACFHPLNADLGGKA